MVTIQDICVLVDAVLQTLEDKGVRTSFTVVSDNVSRPAWLRRPLTIVSDKYGCSVNRYRTEFTVGEQVVSVRRVDDYMVLSCGDCEPAYLDDVIEDTLVTCAGIIDYVQRIEVFAIPPNGFSLKGLVRNLHRKKILDAYYKTIEHESYVIVDNKVVKLSVKLARDIMYVILMKP